MDLSLGNCRLKTISSFDRSNGLLEGIVKRNQQVRNGRKFWILVALFGLKGVRPKAGQGLHKLAVAQA